MLRSPVVRSAALASLSGVLYFLGFVGFGHWYLSWVCLVPWLLALRAQRTWKGALATSALMGVVTHLGGYYWVVHLLREFAGASTAVAVLGYVSLCIFQGAILAASGLVAWAVARRRGLSLALTAPVAIVALELVYPLIFPSYLANSQAFVPAITQIVDLGGVLLLSGLIAFVNGALYEVAAALLERRRVPWKIPAAAALALVASLVYGVVRIGQIDARDAAAPRLEVAIIQANVGAANKHEHPTEGVARFRAMTDAAMALPGIGLVVWPESALNRAVPEGLTNLASAVSSGPKAPMIIGALRTEKEPGVRRVWNSAFALDEKGDIVGRYDKIVRLVFGEYVPGDTIFPRVYELLPYSSHFEKGQSLEPLPVGPYRLAAHICYEDILPDLLRQLMQPRNGARPHALVNITNDSWYGPAEPPIHLALAAFRSTEHRRWMIRSTATGISAFIDASGRVVQQSGFETAETLVQDVPMISGGGTVYGAVGDLVGWVSLVGCGWALVRRQSRSQPAASGGSLPST